MIEGARSPTSGSRRAADPRRRGRPGGTERPRAAGEKLGFLADSAADGREALEKVTTFRPAIVITDLVMPGMDGLELLRALQQQGADVTTLLLTAQGTVETAVEAMKEGAYDYLTKPIDIQRLKILLDKIVERLETLREVKALRRQLREHGTFGSLIGTGPRCGRSTR